MSLGLKYKNDNHIFDEKTVNDVPFLSYPIFEKTGIVNHGFSTRLGKSIDKSTIRHERCGYWGWENRRGNQMVGTGIILCHYLLFAICDAFNIASNGSNH